MPKLSSKEIKSLRRQAKIELAKKSFWEYEKITYPKFFKDNRWHLKQIASILQALYEGRIIKYSENEKWRVVDEIPSKKHITCKKLMLNCPPRVGKSFSLTNFSQWVLGVENENRVITVSYNETLSGRFSKGVRDGIEATRIDEEPIVFKDVFTDTKIKRGDASAQMWSLEGQFFNYLGSSFKGSITGIGCNIGIIDDPIKNKEEAFNDRVLEEHYDFYVNTYLSRLEEGAIQIINMTRWATKDLCGRLLDEEPNAWYVLELEMYDKEKDEMLCPELMSKETYLDKKSKMSTEIFQANYHQKPVDIKGRLYNILKTYESLPPTFERIINYTDTADKGSDFLCSIVAGVYEGEAYILDVLYTQEGMEVTEPKTADFLVENKVNVAHIESNNGGEGFSRNVKKLIWKRHKTKAVIIKSFHQNKNKEARILSNSSFVQEHIYFPITWKDRWPEFYESMITYQKGGKNKHDDAQDAITGICEIIDKPIDVFYVSSSER